MSEKKPTLVIMAAGMGSRFGGLKQITPVGPNGEKLIEYAIYDAVQAGFGKVVFIIKHAIEKDFKEHIGDRIAAHIPVEYVYQELDCLPEGFSVPEGREKPWGTGHAVLCCDGVVDTPFAVINADDYYGQTCFSLLADFFRSSKQEDKLHFAMVGYVLENTLTENGYVSRGVCVTDENGLLTDITERTHIEWRDGKAAFTEDEGSTWTVLPQGAPVSMNCWGFPAGTPAHFKSLFAAFLENLQRDPQANPQKAEFYLPFAVDSMMNEGIADTTVLRTQDKWYGMTYKEDRDAVISAIRRMVDEGKYPASLWE